MQEYTVYLSFCNVQSIRQLGKVLIDVDGLQASSVSSQTPVQRNGVTLRNLNER